MDESAVWGRLISAKEDKTAAIEDERDRLWALWGAHPWNWLSAVDTTNRSDEWPDGRPIYWTTDEMNKAIRPFPSEKAYLKEIVHWLWEERRAALRKNRQMTITTTVCGMIDYSCRFMPNSRWLLSKSTREEAVQIVREKIRVIHGRLPQWVQERSPQNPRPRHIVNYPGTGSAIYAVAENVAVREARGSTNTGVLVDEACFQDNAKEIVGAVGPATYYLWMLSTPYLGSPGGLYFKKMEAEGLERGIEE